MFGMRMPMKIESRAILLLGYCAAVPGIAAPTTCGPRTAAGAASGTVTTALAFAVAFECGGRPSMVFDYCFLSCHSSKETRLSTRDGYEFAHCRNRCSFQALLTFGRTLLDPRLSLTVPRHPHPLTNACAQTDSATTGWCACILTGTTDTPPVTRQPPSASKRFTARSNSVSDADLAVHVIVP